MYQLVVRRVEVEAELVLDLFDLLVEAGDQLHDVRFAAHEAAELLAVAVVIVDGVDQRLRTLFDLIEDEAEHLLLRAHHALGDELLIVLHHLDGFHQAHGIVAACPHGGLARDQTAVGELAHLPIGRPHQGDHITPNARAEFGQLSCDCVHFLFTSYPERESTALTNNKKKLFAEIPGACLRRAPDKLPQLAAALLKFLRSGSSTR